MLTSVQDVLKTVSPNQRCISATQAKVELSNKESLLIDVREPNEHQQQAVTHAMNIPRGLLEFKLPNIEKDAQKPIYLHCATGGRAIFAAEQLTRLGYQDISVITCKFAEIYDAFK
ncbi:rhodanese-like domain-containing protein [Pseudoalteromonas sp. MMG013]|uniref:rhodanese-like domain-containing protein n=1 Tax=unclassified Pseudoalteromonas TaxID=194690 RepID=UPI001B39C053|nr:MULTISPECIES: rhodanese-like domain-containing protein [unclassified Pseudoalteromonas]MBQ4850681.1 rhodanese-like domain-containing protein [Pseudoalteromonas sp. MMG012]MBQ4862723.1 rhodanese-like domain-containing protein [Pseudoalteromonas sp. MMG013]